MYKQVSVDRPKFNLRQINKKFLTYSKVLNFILNISVIVIKNLRLRLI